jgi:dTMP kinase
MTEKHDPWVLALLFAADRRIHCNNLIRKALSAGKWVVADRYVHSSLAYQGAEGVDERWIRLINSPCLWPDISLVIDLGAKTAFARSRSKSLRMNFFEKELQFREKARRRFLRLCERGDAIRVDGRGTTEEVFRRIIATIQKSAGNCFLD